MTSDPVASETPTLLTAFRRSAQAHLDAPLVHCFDGTSTFGEVDAMSGALAAALAADGLGKDEPIALVLQNVPQYFIVVVAA